MIRSPAILDLSTLTPDHPLLQTLVGLALIVGAAVVANLVMKLIVVRVITRALDAASVTLEARHIQPVVRRLANVVPAVVIARTIALVPNLPPEVIAVTRNVCSAFIVLTVVLAVSNVLNVVNEIYARRPGAASRPIKGYIQVLKILLFGAALILMVAALMERSPLLLLSGLGAMAAVLLLVFRDTILSLVASVQLTTNDMLRVGDWIEMPTLDADGDVIDIALHTVKVQNWDKTITTIPTHRLISESFKNWRGMQESGGRRIKRSLMIDQASIHFLTDEERDRLRRFSLLDGYLEKKCEELARWNADLIAAGRDPVNTRRVTNIGMFRAYVDAYLRAHPRIAQDMLLLVRQLQPTAQGLPLEIYCFTATIAWAEYEGIQADIFDHLLSILPEFGLLLFQEPTGSDLRRLVATAAAS